MQKKKTKRVYGCHEFITYIFYGSHVIHDLHQEFKGISKQYARKKAIEYAKGLNIGKPGNTIYLGCR